MEALSRRRRCSSLADKTHNARAILGDLRRIGEAIWSRFNGGRAGTLWYYSSLSEAFDRLLPGALADDFRLTVRQLESLAANADNSP